MTDTATLFDPPRPEPVPRKAQLEWLAKAREALASTKGPQASDERELP
jgi:hypothetical protein